MVGTFVLSLIAILSGTQLTYLYEDDSRLSVRLCTGICSGYALLGVLGLMLAALWGVGVRTILLTAVAVSTPLLLLLRARFRKRAWADVCQAFQALHHVVMPPAPIIVFKFAYSGALAILLWFVFDRAVFERPDGLYTGFVNNLGDLPFHLQVIASFAYGHNFPPQDPTLAGVPFTYSFLVDLVAALFVRSGASLRTAIFVENYVLALALVGLLRRWTWELTKDRAASLIAPVLLLLSGGLGWLLFLRDAWLSQRGFFGLLINPARDYTLQDQFWRWGNCLTTLLVPQRSLLFGMALAICIFTQWWLALKAQNTGVDTNQAFKSRDAQPASYQSQPAALRGEDTCDRSCARMVAAGILAGMLPLIHLHTFLVVMSLGACFVFLLTSRKNWSAFFLSALAIGVPELLWMFRGSANDTWRVLSLHIGWDRGNHNVLWFWLLNTGLFIPLLILSTIWRNGDYLISPRLLRFYLPFILCWIAPNLITLAPWVWDNIKVLIYWYVGSVPLVALLLSRWWRERGWLRAGAAAALATVTLAGALDIWRAVGGTTTYQEFDRSGMQFASQILARTAPQAVILHAPTFNTPVFLTGRRSLLGYPGWIWSRGLDAGPREADIRQIYAGGNDAVRLIARYHVDYLLVGPLERATMTVNDAFVTQYPLTGQSGEYQLHKISQP